MPLAYALIHEEDGVFGISFPDFPGCISGGANAEEAIRKGSEALTFHVAGMVEDGDPLPVPHNLAELRADPAFREDARGAVLALVGFEQPGRAIRLNISMEESLVESVDRAAKAAGQSRSAFLSDAARARLKGAA
jgi:predicted RNase H-like HicB family nuclease